MNHTLVTVQRKKISVIKLSDIMPLFKNNEELIKSTEQWVKNNRELYEYLVEFEQKMINKN